jgi:hypothetical protein
VAEDGGRGVAFVGVAQHAWDEAVPVEGLSVCEVGGGGAGVGGGVVPAAFGEFFSGAVFEFAGVFWCGVEVLVERRFGLLDSRTCSNVPVLKSGTLPSLLAQKLSAWYSAYSGVLLCSLLGLFLSILVVDHCESPSDDMCDVVQGEALGREVGCSETVFLIYHANLKLLSMLFDHRAIEPQFVSASSGDPSSF